MESVKHRDILEYLQKFDIKPKDKTLVRNVELFLLRKFKLVEHEIEEKAYRKFKTEIFAFRKRLRAIYKRNDYRKEDIVSKHTVRNLQMYQLR